MYPPVPSAKQAVTRNGSPGQMLIEAIIGIAVVSSVLVVLLSLSLRTLKIQVQNKEWQKADQLEQEALEAIRQIRDGMGIIRLTDPAQDLPWDWSSETIWENDAPTYFRLYYDAASSWWVLEKTDEDNLADPYFRLSLDETTMRYGHRGAGGFPDDARLTTLYRQIIFSETDNTPISRTLSCVIGWKDGDILHESKLVTILSDW
ncbi:MAG TPA: hypothetical protein PKL83_01180 [bacterium]|nr:hypothetical protein [bacterium]